VALARSSAAAAALQHVDPGEIPADPVESARQAGLRYVNDAMPGIRRVRRGKTIRYVGPEGAPVTDAKELGRIKTLAIPPAWTDVWICAHPRGHLQATGRDARGRKQYRYHPRWRQVRDETKYYRMLAFGEALPRIRQQVDHDLSLPGMQRTRVLAAVVRLLETTLIRVGNEEYARDNKSYGLTTMRNRHVDVEGSALVFHFKGKSGVKHVVGVRDRRLANIVKRSRDLPGQHLFEYVDDDGEVQAIDSGDVNDYLKEITGEDFTAKDFRTWAGTVLAAQALEELADFDSETQARKNIVRAVERVAERLGNTPSVCRKCYVHPEVFNAYLERATIHTVQEQIQYDLTHALPDMDPEEAAVMALLYQRLQRDEQAPDRRRPDGAR